jgi:glutathione S-transferase
MNAPETFQLQLSRFIRAPREKVFDAFITDTSMRAWQCPRGMHIAALSVDAREGGAYRLDMRARDGPSGWSTLGNGKPAGPCPACRR